MNSFHVPKTKVDINCVSHLFALSGKTVDGLLVP